MHAREPHTNFIQKSLCKHSCPVPACSPQLCSLHQIEFYILEIPIITAFNLLQNDIGLKSSNGDHDIILRFRAIKPKNTLIKMHTIKKLKGYEYKDRKAE